MTVQQCSSLQKYSFEICDFFMQHESESAFFHVPSDIMKINFKINFFLSFLLENRKKDKTYSEKN